MNGWKVASLIALMAALVPLQPIKAKAEDSALERQENAVLQCEKQEKWKTIAWRSTMDQALKDAQKVQKPILVAFVVGKNARKNASDC